MINVNPGSGVKDVVGVFINPGGGVKTCDAVWENVGGTLYQVWPVAHTAYDGSTFKGALNGGLVSGITVYCKYYNGSDSYGTAANRTIYADYEVSTGTANKTATSGAVGVSYNYGNDASDVGWYEYPAWRSKSLVNISLYDSVTTTFSTSSRNFATPQFAGICLTNSAGTSATFVEASDGVCDVSGITGQYYITFVWKVWFSSTTNIYRKYWYGNITSIAFA